MARIKSTLGLAGTVAWGRGARAGAVLVALGTIAGCGGPSAGESSEQPEVSATVPADAAPADSETTSAPPVTAAPLPAPVAPRAAPAPLAFPPDALPSASLSQRYSVSLRPAGADVSVPVTLIGGRLPRGLSVNPNGTLSGVPEEWGDFTFEVQASTSRETAAMTYALRVTTRLMLVYRGDDRVPGLDELFAVNVGAGAPYTPQRISAALGASEHVNGEPSWSADGKYLTYATHTEDGRHSYLYFVDLTKDAARPALVSELATDPVVTWPRDESTHFVVQANGRAFDVAVQDGAPGMLHPVTDPTDGARDAAPSMTSPDGKFRYATTDAEDPELLNLNEILVSTGEVAHSFEVPRESFAGLAALDGRTLLTHYRGDALDVDLCDFSTAGLSCDHTLNAEIPGAVVDAASLAPDGLAALYVERDPAHPTAQVYVADLRSDVRAGVPVSGLDGVASTPRWSPGSTHRIAAVRQASNGKRDLTLTDTSGFTPSTPVTLNGPGNVSAFSWQPVWR